MMGEAAVMVREANEAAYLATVYDGNPEPTTFMKTQNSPDFSYWWEAMCTELRNIEHEQVWEFNLNTSVPTGRKIIGCRWVLA
jgi:hypothetical protein